MKIIRIGTDNEVSAHDFPEGTLQAQNQWLKALIGPRCEIYEHVLPKRLYTEFGVPNGIMRERGSFVSMLVDEDGISHGLEPNLVGSYLYGTDEHGQPIVGNILLIGEKIADGGIEFCGISDRRFELLYPQMEEITRKAREVYGNHNHSCS
ncbi:DUF3846 domain-containing protein [Acetatifactor aquisgranensis]|uniref:DUF3846 domain-containing protein n=1 Tax=Acetatifactor aquisgranensis TaxID=2941233 RepID=UPI00203AE1A2|nr:DUF3846 domain-containing protein [Acetatifactor aquisgranensis]